MYSRNEQIRATKSIQNEEFKNQNPYRVLDNEKDGCNEPRCVNRSRTERISREVGMISRFSRRSTPEGRRSRRA